MDTPVDLFLRRAPLRDRQDLREALARMVRSLAGKDASLRTISWGQIKIEAFHRLHRAMVRDPELPLTELLRDQRSLAAVLRLAQQRGYLAKEACNQAIAALFGHGLELRRQVYGRAKPVRVVASRATFSNHRHFLNGLAIFVQALRPSGDDPSSFPWTELRAEDVRHAGKIIAAARTHYRGASVFRDVRRLVDGTASLGHITKDHHAELIAALEDAIPRQESQIPPGPDQAS